MTRSIDAQTAGPAPTPSSDRPPVGRFFMLFCALVALALGLALLSEAGAASDDDAAALTQARAGSSQLDSNR